MTAFTYSQKKVYNFYTLFILLFTLIISGIAVADPVPKTISGVFSFPEIIPLGSGDRDIEIEAYDDNFLVSYSTYITIPEGEQSASYSLNIGSDEDIDLAVIFRCQNCDETVFQYGYYASVESNTTTLEYDTRTFLPDGRNQTGVNMTAIRASLIRGTVILQQAAPAEGLDLNIFVRSPDNLTYIDFLGGRLHFEAGDTEAEYAIKFLPNPQAKLLVSYICFDCPSPYVGSGYYANGVTNTTVYSESKSTSFLASTSYSEINLTVISGKVISGTFHIPKEILENDLPAYLGGEIGVRITANSHQEDGRSSYIRLSPIHDTVDYSISLPPGDIQWRIKYQCRHCPVPLVKQGVYASGEPETTSADFSKRTLLGGDSDHPNINMTAVPGMIISGKVTLPEVASHRTLVYVIVHEEGTIGDILGFAGHPREGSYVKTLVFDVDDIAKDYIVSAPSIPDTKWIVEYRCIGCESSIIDTGYYAENEPNTTIWDLSQATLLEGAAYHPNIDLTLDRGVSVSGNDIPIADGKDDTAAADATAFGEHPVGTPTTQTFKLTNNSNRAIKVISIDLQNIVQNRSTRARNGDDFTVITPVTFTIPAGGSVNIEIEFQPSRSGLQQRDVIVSFDNGTTHTFQVTGSATQAVPTSNPQNVPIFGPFGLLASLLGLLLLGHRRKQDNR